MDDEVDDSLKCPISLELFQDPVIGADDRTYERKNITAWLKAHGTSPLTRQPMSEKSLQPNYVIQKLVDEFLSKFNEQKYHYRLDVDIRKCEQYPWLLSYGKIIYKAEWINKEGPSIILHEIDGVRACREASFYAQLSSHPNIVRTFGLVHSDPNLVVLLQESSSYHDLAYQLREQNFRPSAKVLLKIFVQIVNALIYLAENGIIHGDVACRNVLASRLHETDPKCNLFKLSNFGLMQASTLFSMTDPTAITPLKVKPVRYCAPEILRKKDSHLNYSEKSDVFSTGVLIWEAHSHGQLPFESVASDREVKRIRRAGGVLEQPRSCNTELWSLVTTCWEIDPDMRPSFQTLKETIMEILYGSNNPSASASSIDQNDDTLYCLDDSELPDLYQYFDDFTQDAFLRRKRQNNHETGTIDSNLENIEVACTYCHKHYSIRRVANHEFQCQYSQQLNVSNRNVPPIFSQDFHETDDIKSNLATIACSYCQETFPLEELDTHEELCLSNHIEAELMNNTATKSMPSKPIVSAKTHANDERKHHNMMPSTVAQTTSTNKLISSKKTKSRVSLVIDTALLSLYEMMNNDLNKFVFTAVPSGLGSIKCRVTRLKDDFYMLHALHPSEKTPIFLLAAHKRRWHAMSTYVIAIRQEDLRQDGLGLAILQAKSLFGIEYVIYRQELYNEKRRTTDGHQNELAAVQYETNVLGWKGPRKMTVLLPTIHDNNEPITINSRSMSGSLLDRWKRGDTKDLAAWHNKPPIWNESTQSYTLHFHGRVNTASVKNFQLVHNNDRHSICLEFGRESPQTFACDYWYPLSAVQAFGIVLSSLDRKLGCE